MRVDGSALLSEIASGMTFDPFKSAPMRTALLLACSLSATGIAHAQAPATDAPPAESVEVKGLKNPALMPYRKAYDLAAGVEQAGSGHARLSIRVTSNESHQPLPDLSLRIVGENTDARVPVSPDGHVDLPLDKAFYDDKADIVANKPAKALNVDIHVVPRLPAGEIHFSDLADATSAGQAALAQIVPWYVRALTPSLHGIGLCYPSQGHEVTVGQDKPVARAASEVDTDPDQVKVFCARFSSEELAADPRALLSAPPGWEAVYW